MKIITYLKNLKKYIKSGGVVKITFNKVAPDKRFVGQTILVTGGASGIGYEITKEYIQEGAHVVITGRNESKLQEAVKNLRSDFVSYIVWDHSNPAIALDKINEGESIFGKFDVFVNNAGVFKHASWDKVDESMYDYVCDTNSKGLFFMCQAEGKYFFTNKIKGRIINICSVAGIKSEFDPYSVSKWGAVCITKGLAKDLVKHNIIVNGIAPGNVVTNIHSGVIGKDVEENAYMPLHLTNRYTLVEEIAGMVLYLTSDLGSNIVGQIITIDGGWTLY